MNKFLEKTTRLGLPSALAAVFVAIFTPFFVNQAGALPDDKNQDIIVNANSSEVFLDEGKVIYRGLPQQPAVVTQGSRKISGLEIIVERSEGEIRRITVSGTPAHFQQQPEIDKGIIYAEGETILYEEDKQLLTVNESARLIQEGNTLSGYRIEYNFEAKTARAMSRNSEEQVNMVIPPQRQD
ncbi:MAG: lipopolysaccharide transport periplasmic protein LptA [Pseudomonadales bacterium]|nr:lipopolysaccharide transport periplasmic protein LptA [Pseudomonadales bacterium]